MNIDNIKIPRLSAFAAAKEKRKLEQLKNEANAEINSEDDVSIPPSPPEDPTDRIKTNDPIEYHTEDLEDHDTCPSPLEPLNGELISSLWRPTNANIQKTFNGAFEVQMNEHEIICLVGEYNLEILSGEVSIYGAKLGPAKRQYSVYAPSTHALPEIECKSANATVIFSLPEGSMQVLGLLSPLYRKIWNTHSHDSGQEMLSCNLFSYWEPKSNDSLTRSLRSLRLPEAWTVELDSGLISNIVGTQHICTVSGPKGSDKSTFARILANDLLSKVWQAQTNEFNESTGHVRWVDLDPSQPEFTPPGQLSVVDVHIPILGPAFTHTVPHYADSYSIKKSFSLGILDAVQETERYKIAVKQILQYCQFDHSLCPTIFNLPTWAGFSGLHLLIDTIKILQNTSLKPQRMCYLGPVPTQFMQAFREYLHCLPIEPKIASLRSAAELRDMQNMAYFHSQVQSTNDDKNKTDGISRWNGTPLVDVLPWVVSYSSDCPGFQAILQMAEIHPSNMLSTVLSGNVVAISRFSETTAATTQPEDSGQENDGKLNTHILRTPSENIPYYAAESIPTLLSTKGVPECLGYAIVRGIDFQNQTLHLLTPLPMDSILDGIQESTAFTGSPLHEGDKMNNVDMVGSEDKFTCNQSLILTLGHLNVPSWAYTEAHYLADYLLSKERRKGIEYNIAADKVTDSASHASSYDVDKLEETIENAPWVKEASKRKTSSIGMMKRRMRRF